MRHGPFWFRGTADAVFQNLELIIDEQPGPRLRVRRRPHLQDGCAADAAGAHRRDADLTIATIPVPARARRTQFGIVEIDDDCRVTGFVEKPKDGAKTMPGRPDMVLASMGNYIFKPNVLIDDRCSERAARLGARLRPRHHPGHVSADEGATRTTSRRTTIPGEERARARLLARRRHHRRVLRGVDGPGLGRRRCSTSTTRCGRSISAPLHLPPAKFVFADAQQQRIGIATDSLVSDGCIISGGTINRCVLRPRVRIN